MGSPPAIKNPQPFSIPNVTIGQGHDGDAHMDRKSLSSKPSKWTTHTVSLKFAFRRFLSLRTDFPTIESCVTFASQGTDEVAHERAAYLGGAAYFLCSASPFHSMSRFWGESKGTGQFIFSLRVSLSAGPLRNIVLNHKILPALRAAPRRKAIVPITAGLLSDARECGQCR